LTKSNISARRYYTVEVPVHYAWHLATIAIVQTAHDRIEHQKRAKKKKNNHDLNTKKNGRRTSKVAST